MGKRVGVIGCGLIGDYLVRKLMDDPDLDLAFVYDTDTDKVSHLADYCISNLADSGQKDSDLVVECANRQAVWDYAPVILKKTDMLILSVTALADDSFKKSLEVICQEYKTRLYVSHGAILGVDGIHDGSEVLRHVEITTTKSPKNFGRDDVELRRLYKGSVREVCDLYPRSVNVHATLALAGIGFDDTISEIIVDPDTNMNTHLIEARSDETTFRLEISSKRAGKVTGAYTLESTYQTVRRICLKKYGLSIV